MNMGEKLISKFGTKIENGLSAVLRAALETVPELRVVAGYVILTQSALLFFGDLGHISRKDHFHECIYIT